MRQIPELEQLNDQFRQLSNNWETSIVVPLTQNIGGGMAATIILAVLTYAWNRLNALTFDINETLIWAGIVGTIITCLATVARFFSDEIGLLYAAYKVGQSSRDEEIQRLNRQISLLEQQPSPQIGTMVSQVNQKLGIMQGDYNNAVSLLKILLDGGSAARNNSEHGLTRRPWERAVSLLEKSKVYSHEQRELLIPNRSESTQSLKTFYQEQYNRAKENNAFHPAWW